MSTVPSLQEAKHHPHNRARNACVTVGAFERPAPAPRFSSSWPTPATMPSDEYLSPSTMLARFGFAKAEIDDLVKTGLLTDN